ncbi:unnamed protein product [Penicillium salamii]|uniref:Aminoglycoside phosphotransferase domain-containing protein n=1 Tax=Penicillium salamii TaxID=1612424 RepID=A0A9W4NCL2_9EURO|nr:unnamed protein product [Penicillium salamii]CAG8021578.1 unnamed protein product [Penicillium salamii]CAG8128959.1 unnamed protein product [Penicillium salamii]CAG8322247.1 unnamed protein product [Penicillium salamii]CAG8349244.1 unnamed protein product [Penicillium salamii]
MKAKLRECSSSSSIPVPQVFAYEFHLNNSAIAAFILKDFQELFPSSVAIDALGGYQVYRGVIPKEHQTKFYDSVAKCYVFFSVQAYIYADSFPEWYKKTIIHMMQRNSIPAERIVSIIESFPLQMKAIANWLSLCKERLFLLFHDDFLHSKIMVYEKDFVVTGFIDWEGVYTAL